MQNEIYCNQTMKNIYFRVCVEYLIDEKERDIDNYNY